MTALGAALLNELIKLRRTLALWAMLLAPLAIVALQVGILARLPGGADGAPVNGWAFLLRNSLGFWVLLMLPLFVAVATTLLAAVEHGPGMWTQHFALPAPRWHLLVAKLAVALLLVGGATALLLAGVGLAGAMVVALGLRPDLAWGAPEPGWDVAATAAALSWLLAGMMVSIQTVISLRWANVLVPLGVGVVATIVGFVAVNSPALAQLYPWALPFAGFAHYAGEGSALALPLALSVGGSIVVTLVGAWELGRREVV